MAYIAARTVSSDLRADWDVWIDVGDWGDSQLTHLEAMRKRFGRCKQEVIEGEVS